MDFLLAFVIASLIGAGAVAAVILWASNHSAATAITRHFKASEYILEHHQPPPEWLQPAWHRRLIGKSQPPTKAALLARLDALIRFFENSGFYENEWTREQLLSQLAAEREHWQDSLRL